MKRLIPFYPLDPNSEHYSEDWTKVCQETWIKPLEEIGLKFIGHISWPPTEETGEGVHVLNFEVPVDADVTLIDEKFDRCLQEEDYYVAFHYVWNTFTIYVNYTA